MSHRTRITWVTSGTTRYGYIARDILIRTLFSHKSGLFGPSTFLLLLLLFYSDIVVSRLFSKVLFTVSVKSKRPCKIHPIGSK